MRKKPPTQRQLLAENEDLRGRLEIAEGTLREIVSGEADALFVQGVGGKQVFTLKGADQSYRTLIESMSEGALTMTAEGMIVYANRRFAEMLGTPLTKVIGSEIHTWVAPESRQVLQTLLRKDAVGNRREELALAAADGTQVPVYLSVNRLVLNEAPDSLCMVATDLTEQKRNDVLLAAGNLERAILEQAADAIVICDESGRIFRASKQAQAFHDENLLGQLFEHAFPLRELDGTTFSPLGAIDSSPRQSVEARLECNGKDFDLLVNVGHLTGARSELLGSVVTLTDITERKRTEISIKRLNRVYAVLSGINTLIVRVRDRDELFREACRIAVDQGGFRMAMLSLVDRSTMKTVPVASAGVEENLLSAIKARLASSDGGTITMIAQASKEKRAIVSNDSRNDPRVSFAKGYAEAGVRSMAILPLIVSNEAIGVLALYAEEAGFFDEEENKLLTDLAGDISFAIDHIDKQEQLDYLAYYDALTGLANRALFHVRLEQIVLSAHKQGRKLALVLLDIERFKTINDTLGWAAGDALIKEVAARMTVYALDVARLARKYADHFALMVPDVQSEGDLARLVEQCVGKVFGPPFPIGDAELRVSAKFGIAMFPVDGADADTLFRNAEAALGKAKATGERYLFYTQTMNERVAEKLSLESNLRQALDKEEFVLHYQPKVNLASGKLTSAEALIRWNDPRTGLVPPLQFIPILEETGLIHEVGRWVLRKAIEDYLRWHAAGLAVVRIAVNVSSLQLRNHSFIAEIEQAIGIDPHAAAGLELEITESLIMEDVKHSIVTLQAIRAMGVTIAIDDFGTGFSSLSYLSRLPVDTLKIERSFVIGMTTGPQGLALVSTIINLAHALKIKVVAEGVETEEQSRLLQLLNCDEMQGYLFSKPLPGEIFQARYLASTG
jgi:diguanylate cyclase (GGDEF)-like protein/PAS domain S-box-containing protein